MILKYELTQNNETKYAVVTGLENNNQSSNKLVIPCTTQIGSISYPVLEISKSAFNGCKDLEEVFKEHDMSLFSLNPDTGEDIPEGKSHYLIIFQK